MLTRPDPRGPASAWTRTPAATAVLWLLALSTFVLLYEAWTHPLLQVTVKAALPPLVPEPFRAFTILDETRSVVSMVDRLMETNYQVIAALIVVFGMALPVLKNLGVVLVLAARAGTGAARTAAVLQFVGRFAMVDVFAIGIVVSVMAAGTIGEGENQGLAAVETITSLQSGFWIFLGYIAVSTLIDVLLALRYRVRP